MKLHFLSAVPSLCILAATYAANAAENPPVPPSKPLPDNAVSQHDMVISVPQLLHAIKDEIGEAACDTDAQCHSIGVGASPCGGPEAYFSWSSMKSDGARLKVLIAQHRDGRRQEKEKSGLLSNCRAVLDPGAVCRPRAKDAKRVCQPGQGGQRSVD